MIRALASLPPLVKRSLLAERDTEGGSEAILAPRVRSPLLALRETCGDSLLALPETP